MGTKSCTKILKFWARFSSENLAVEDFVTLVRPTLMGTKNLYENRPKPVFLFGTKNMV